MNGVSLAGWKWVKSQRLAVIAASLTTIFALIAGAGNVFPILIKMIDRPDCLTYASGYRGPWSDFKLSGNKWNEYARDTGTLSFEFRELRRDRETIDILNLTLRPDIPGWQTLMVRLPVCGGTAKISVGIVQTWTNLFEVQRF